MRNETKVLTAERPKRPELPVGQILLGDARERLAQLPSGSIDTVVTSPPYFMLRDYGVQGQIGAEENVEQWVDGLLAVLAEARRVLKPSGSVWLNLGDTYSRHPRHGTEAKSLLLGPERLALALTRAGWSVRNKLVWQKPNPMPTSVRDRLSCTWEPVYLLTKSRHYFFDLDAIRQPTRSRLKRPSVTGPGTKYGSHGGKRPSWSGPLAGTNSGLDAMKANGRSSHPLGKNPGDVWTIPTAAYRGAHFATFPPRLVERPLRATCPERVCAACGQPWRRSTVQRSLGSLAVLGQLRKSCACPDRAWQPGVVLDPFMGAGTVALVAEAERRRWIGIELSEAFREQALARLAAARTANETSSSKGGDHGNN